MATSNLPKAVLFSPNDPDVNEDATSQSIKTSAKFNERIIIGCAQTMQESHQARIKALRKELDYLKDTEWKYEPIDKYMGQST